MRGAFWIGVALSTLATLISIVSLFHAGWLSPSRATRISLGQGRLWIWSGQPNDFSAFTAGFTTGGWTGNAIDWTPELDRKGRLAVPIAPPSPNANPNTPIAAKMLIGLSITIPMWMPLAITIIPTGLLPVAIRLRARRRAARGRCRACGYDLGGVAGPCPECGTLLRRLLRVIGARLARWAVARPRAGSAFPSLTSRA